MALFDGALTQLNLIEITVNQLDNRELVAKYGSRINPNFIR
jgi:hypothetical protein